MVTFYCCLSAVTGQQSMLVLACTSERGPPLAVVHVMDTALQNRSS